MWARLAAAKAKFADRFRDEVQLGFAMRIGVQAERAKVRHGQLATSPPVVIGVEQVIPEPVDDPGGLVEVDPMPFGQGLDDPRAVDRLILTDELGQRASR